MKTLATKIPHSPGETTCFVRIQLSAVNGKKFSYITILYYIFILCILLLFIFYILLCMLFKLNIF